MTRRTTQTVRLVDPAGKLLRRTKATSDVTFLLNLEDGYYYDRKGKTKTFMRRTRGIQ